MLIKKFNRLWFVKYQGHVSYSWSLSIAMHLAVNGIAS